MQYRVLTTSLIAVALALPGAAGRLAAQQADSSRAGISREPLFTRRDAMYAAAFAGGTLAMLPFDKRMVQWLQKPARQNNRVIANAATGFRLMGDPGSLIIGVTMYAVGRIGRFQRVTDLGLHGTEAIAASGIVTGLIKGVAGRARPYAVADTTAFDFKLGRGFRKGGRFSSLPSGHTTAAFAAAAAVTAETSRWWPGSTWLIAPVMFGGATLVGASRLYNDKHWASDVVLAAAIGTFGGFKSVKYNHSHPGNRLDRLLLAPAISATASGARIGAHASW